MRRTNRRKTNIPLTRNFSDVEASIKRVSEFQQYKPFLKDKLTEQEVNLLMRRINAKKVNIQDLFKASKRLYDGKGYDLSDEQNKKGLDFLKKRTFAKNGDIKDSSELREREASIISDPNAKITLKDFYSERGNYYVPLYKVSGDNTSMEYYYLGGKINVVG